MTTETILSDERIAEALVKNGIFLSEGEVTGYDIDFARAIEQAVLQSPEIQALRKGAERIRFVADDGCEFNTWIQDDYKTKYRLEWNQGAEWQSEWFDTPEDAIDAAMEQKK